MYSRRITDLGFDQEDVESERKGRESEGRVQQVLEKMQETGEIHHFRKSKDWGELDVIGIDFQIYPEHDWSIDLQVKSSEVGKESHVEKYGHSIACIVVHEAMSDNQLLEEMRRILGLSIEAITKRH